MADWLKLNHSLVRSPKVRGLMRELKCKKHAALGVAVAWLVWIDEQTTDGATRLLPDELDDELGFRGCADALCRIGWAALGEDGCVEALEFGKHCGDSAKERAENARRVAKCKASKKRVMDEVTQECYQGNEKTLPNALPEKKRIYIDRKGELSTTVDTSSPDVPCPPAPEDFAGWLRAVGAVIPMLRRLNLDRPLPRRVEAEARAAAELVPMTPETVELLRRYYAAETVKGWRPDSLERFFEDLPDVLQHAANWCRQDDREQRKAAATARRKAKEASVEAECGTSTPEDKKAFFEGLWRDLGGQSRERSDDEETCAG